MKSKKIRKYLYIFIFVSITVLLLTLVLILLPNSKEKLHDNKIPNDYIAVFNGGSGEITYKTYIYKINNKKENMGFKYINTTCTTKSWGSSEYNENITAKGKITFTDGVFEVAEDNNAYSYVTIPL